MNEKNENGMYIRLYDSLLEDEMWKECKPNTFKVWIGLLLKAQKYTNGEYKSGSVYESKEYLAKEIFHISTNTLDSCLQELESMKKISQETIIKYGKRYGTKITIKNWKKYQNFEPTSKIEVSGKYSKSNGYESLTSKVEDRTEVRTEVRTEDTKYNNIDSSLRSSSNYSEKEREEGKETDAASLRSADATAAESAFSEKDKGQGQQVPSGLYQPKPVKAPEFPMSQQPLSGNEENAFGIVEVFDRLKLYLPSGYSLDKNQQSFIRTEYFKIANPNRRQGTFRKQNGDLWDLYGFTEWMAKLLREQGVPALEKPSVPSQPAQTTPLRWGDKGSGFGGKYTPQDLKRLGVKIIGL